MLVLCSGITSLHPSRVGARGRCFPCSCLLSRLQGPNDINRPITLQLIPRSFSTSIVVRWSELGLPGIMAMAGTVRRIVMGGSSTGVERGENDRIDSADGPLVKVMSIVRVIAYTHPWRSSGFVFGVARKREQRP